MQLMTSDLPHRLSPFWTHKPLSVHTATSFSDSPEHNKNTIYLLFIYDIFIFVNLLEAARDPEEHQAQQS
jgi:hypothetical protein